MADLGEKVEFGIQRTPIQFDRSGECVINGIVMREVEVVSRSDTKSASHQHFGCNLAVKRDSSRADHQHCHHRWFEDYDMQMKRSERTYRPFQMRTVCIETRLRFEIRIQMGRDLEKQKSALTTQKTLCYKGGFLLRFHSG